MIERRLSTGPNGLHLAVLGWNTEASGRPLIVLHGFLEQALAWSGIAERLGRPVWALDHRGHGRSDHVGPGGYYHFWDYVSDLDSVAETLVPNGPFDLLGHSMGGTVAVLYAGSRPERVRRLVLVEGLGPPDSTAGALQRARTYLRHRREGLTHRSPFADIDAAAARMKRFNPALAPEEARALAERQTVETDGGHQWRWDARHRGRSPRPFDERHFLPFLEAIEAPTLAIAGARSSYPRFERAAHLREVRTQLLEAGHLVHHDAPEALSDAVRAFLEEG